MGYEPEFDTFEFKEQYDDSLHAYILASLSSFPSPSHETLPSVLSFSSPELKPLPIPSNMLSRVRMRPFL